MKKTIEKYLIDTSAVRPVLGDSTREQNAHATEQLQDGAIWSSVYLRMEYIRRWVCDTIRMATTISMCTDVSDALVIIEQDFSPRSVKGAIAVLSRFLRERGIINNTRIAAEEVGGMAVRMLEKYDLVFTKRIPDKTGCQIGGLSPEVNYDRLLEDLGRYYLAFLQPVKDCEVNTFLQLSRAKSRLDPILKDEKTKKLDVVINILKLKEEGAWITCKECKSIGDGIISLEQPASWSLVHVDKSFNDLCRVLDKKRKSIRSVLALKGPNIP